MHGEPPASARESLYCVNMERKGEFEEEIIVLHNERSMVQQLPLHHSLQEGTIADAAKSSAVCKQPTVKNDNKKWGSAKMIAAQNETAQKVRDCASFTPPAYISGITNLMLL